MIGIFGGSFDPVHIGHLRCALEIYQDLGLQQLRLIPSGVPPHRTPPLASVEQRLAMLQAGIAGGPGLSIDTREISRQGPSFSVDTLTSLRAEIGDLPLCLIVGMDAFLAFHTWHRWRDIVTLAHIVVAHRPGRSISDGKPAPELAALLTDRQTGDPRELGLRPAGQILCWPVTQLDIASVQIRALIAAGKSPRYLVPDAVADIISTQDIYRYPPPPGKEFYAIS